MTADLAKMLADAKAFVSGDDANSIRMPKYLMEAYEDVKGTGLKLEEERAAHIDCHVKLHEKARAIIALIERCDRAETAKDSAYSERNQLVAYLAHLFPSCLERHPVEDKEWEDDWRWIVFIHHPNGQLSWHIHDSELPLFDHVPHGTGNVKWDGHTTEEKYERLRAALPAEEKP